MVVPFVVVVVVALLACAAWYRERSKRYEDAKLLDQVVDHANAQTTAANALRWELAVWRSSAMGTPMNYDGEGTLDVRA